MSEKDKSKLKRKSKPRLKTRVKEEEKLQEAKAKTEWKLAKKKPLDVSLRQHIGKMFDNTKLNDAVELSAIGIFTIVCHETILSTPVLAEKGYKMYLATTGLAGFLIWQLLPPFTKRVQPKDFTEEAWYWLLSFCCAYIIVKHGGQLIGLLDKGVTGILSLLLGA